MTQWRSGHPVIGFISTWPVYQGTTIDRLGQALMQGISAAARDQGCHLLLGAGVSAVADHGGWRAVWPVPASDSDFVPVGPWNTDGLIIVPDDLSGAQSSYAQDLRRSGFPVVFTTPEVAGPLVVVDNVAGIREAVRHLIDHGHRQIAYIAGKQHRGGDSAERLAAFRDTMLEAGLAPNPRLIAYGEHRLDGGAAAMREILAVGLAFSAFVASNDLSCLGAIEALRSAGRRVPEDVAAIGFDDILDARASSPTLTTVRHPTFEHGYQAVLALLDQIAHPTAIPARVVVPTRLIRRQSCGCPRDRLERAETGLIGTDEALRSLGRSMAAASFAEARQSSLETLESQCHDVVRALVASAEGGDEGPLRAETARLLARAHEVGEDAHVWQAAVSALYRNVDLVRTAARGADEASIMGLLDQARLQISEHVQRLTTRALLDHIDVMSRLGLLTSQLLATLGVSEISELLAEQLPGLGVDHFLVATYDADEDEPGTSCETILAIGFDEAVVGRRFRSREFPPAYLYPGDRPLQLLILPLIVDERTTGFVVLSAANLEPAAAIVTNLATALRASRLYREALQGRRLAEEANQLKSRFMSMVSHELRTPLSIVVGLSDIVLREARESGGLSRAAERDLERMVASAEHLGRLIGDVLDLASSEAGQLRFVRQPIDLAEVLAGVAAAGQQLAIEKGLTWEADIPASGPWVSGDRTRLRQVALNLVGNAVKFTETGGVALSARASDGRVTVSVTDTGPGVAPDEQAIIFDEFQRSTRTAPGGAGGLGLGLAIARRLIELHGGTIELESPGPGGVGSRFSFHLATVAAPLGAAAGPTDPGVVIVLTTRPAVDDLLVDHLVARGFSLRVEQVDGDTDWQAIIGAHRPGAIVLDETLAAERGWELIRLLKRRPGFEGVPVLAYRLDAAADRGGLLDLNYLPKPIRPGELADELARQGIAASGGPAGPTVLVVDDDPDILDIHSRVVSEAGGRALRAADGATAIAAMERIRPDLVLLDLGMPEMDGFAVLEAMRTRAATRDVPVIVVTGQTLGDADIERLNHGVAAILSKGVFTARETIDLIDRTLTRRRVLGGAARLLVRQAVAYIEANHTEPIGRDDIAQHVSISPDYLTDCFHQELGLTPITYLNRYRIRQAKDLLDRSDRSITAIAMEVGFSDVSYFTRTFHRDVGVSPRAYRGRVRGGR